MNIVEYPDRDMMMMSLADRIAAELVSTLMHEDRATLVVPGGTTPGPVFDTLSTLHLEWDRVDVMLSDERWVPETSDRSNTRLLRERLLVGPAAAARLLPLYAPYDTPEEGLDALAAQIEGSLPITTLLVGMGADMHTASLFPGADKLEQALDPHAPILLPMRAPGAPEPRITLTAPVLRAAVNTHIVITGDEKRAALETAAKTHDPALAPISILLHDATIHWAK